MATLRSQIIAAVRTALAGPGKPAGLVVTSRTVPAAELDVLPRMTVSRVHEDVQKAYPTILRSPLVDRHLRIRLDMWIGGDEPEDALEVLLAWATQVMMQDQSWGGLALDTNETLTEWDTEQGDTNVGHAWAEYTIRFPTKTADQGVKQ